MSKGIVMLDCELHGEQYDRDWCPFCRIDDLKKEVSDGVDAGWHSLRMERDRYRKAMEEIVFECKMGVNHQNIVEDVSNIATGALWEDKP
jgi:hypothetical protein